MIKLSICIPTYQGERYLREALESASKVPGTDIEILVCDDVSSDQTMDILAEHQKVEPRLRIHRNRVNLGLVGNWNNCINRAQGEWIKFLFQDDVLEDSFFPEVQPFLEGSCDFIAFSRRFIFEPDANPHIADYLSQEYFWLDQIVPESKLLTPHDFASVVIQMFGYNFIGEPSNILFRRRVIFAIGPYNASLSQYPDLEFCYRLGLHCGIQSIPKTLSRFRVHGQSTTTHNRTKNAFQSEDLDMLILCHEAMFTQSYAPLRTVANACGFSWDAMLSRKLNQLTETVLDPQNRESCKNVLQAYPKLAARLRDLSPQAWKRIHA